jgi:hypothetical protein
VAAADVAGEPAGRIDGGTVAGGLCAAASKRLGHAWGREVVAVQTPVSLPDRCVFTTTGPRGEPAVIKVDAKAWRSARERRHRELLSAASESGSPPIEALAGGA